ncbi:MULTISPECIES: cell division protein ZapA [Brevundimonas]|uniref:cell division protein ZapA n=1 Tax=Brevundimonas TaxID=41275 RepID=UPI000F02569A|nr:cell division protein ZapA [Brevundimonas lutea]
MATVTIEVNGRPYAIGCADGQEERVRMLARQFDGNVQRVAGEVGQVGDIRLFLMAALILADELHEARLAPGGRAAEASVDNPVEETSREDRAEPGLAEALNAAAARIERLAASL